jgi:hypothetical protein
LSDIGARNQSIDQDKHAGEIVALIVIRRGKINLLSFMQQPGKPALHQAHDVGGDQVTGRRSDAATR